jgi:hypothetical protein
MNDLTGHLTELPGGMQVRRLLPAAAARAVGPFVFFDHFGPVTLPPALDSDVGGHPHIGLATVTYLFEGAMLHRDSLGTEQLIEPGAINWMHAGHGIVHSERTPPALRGQARPLHGLQLWVALPPGQTGTPPSFQHVAATDIPEQAAPGARLRLLVGEWQGLKSPVRTVWPTLYLAVDLEPGAALQLPALQAPHDQWALYAPQAGLTVDGQPLPPQRMRLLDATQAPRLVAGAEGARAVLVGGQALPQLPRMWWNFVAYDRSELAEAARRWEQGGFDPIPGETQRVAAPPWKD